MREETKKRDLLLSHTYTSFFFPTTYRVFYLCLSCVLGYGWKRLDFDIRVNDQPCPPELQVLRVIQVTVPNTTRNSKA